VFDVAPREDAASPLPIKDGMVVDALAAAEFGGHDKDIVCLCWNRCGSVACLWRSADADSMISTGLYAVTRHEWCLEGTTLCCVCGIAARTALRLWSASSPDTDTQCCARGFHLSMMMFSYLVRCSVPFRLRACDSVALHGSTRSPRQ
jgi:hypothetical protein